MKVFRRKPSSFRWALSLPFVCTFLYMCSYKDAFNSRAISETGLVSGSEEVAQFLSSQYQDTSNLPVQRVFMRSVGLGASFQLLSINFLEALHQKHCLWLDESVPWSYAAPRCKEKTFSCYFQPTPDCSAALAKPIIDLEEMTRLSKKIVHYKFPNYTDEMVPLRFRDKGLYWWFAHLQNHLFLPNPDILQFILDTKRGMKWSDEVIGIHVRHGDKKEHRHWTLDDYMRHAYALKERFGVSTVFLSTDDLEIIRESAKYSKDFRLMFVDESRQDTEKAVEIAKWLETNQDRAYTVAAEVIRAIYLLGECNYLIGTCLSQFARTAAALQFARGNARYAPIGMDAYSCLKSSKHYFPVLEGWVEEVR